VIDSVKKRLLVIWHELVIVEGLESLDFPRCGLWFRVVVYKPASDVGVQASRYDVEKVLCSLSAHVDHYRIYQTSRTWSMLPTKAKFELVSFFVVTRTLYRCAAVM
jgi:hypothetical protein